MALAAVSFAWGIALPIGVGAAAAGAAIGVLVGERLGKSQLRLWAAVGGVALGALGAHLLAAFCVDSSFIATRLGPGTTLRLASVLRLGFGALALTAGLRAVALRRPVAVGLELATVAVAIPITFSAHRDGVIARPLWLGDWAWSRGFDPALALLAIGGAAVAVLAILLLAEGKSRRAPSAFLALALLTVLAIFLLRKVGLPQPDVLGGLADGGVGDGGSTNPDGGDGGDAGRRRRHRGGGDAGDQQQAETSDGGDDDEEEESGDGGGESQRPPDFERQSQKGSDTPMAVLILDEDYSPPSQGYYLRQEAWSELNGTRLVRATRSGVDGDVPDGYPSQPTAVQGAPKPPGRTEVHTTVVLLVDHPRPFALEAPTLLSPAQNPNPTRFKRAFKVTSLSQNVPYAELFGHASGDPAWPADVRAYYVAGPDDPRYGVLARSIVERMPERMRTDPFAQAVAIKLKLDDAFKYSTKHAHHGAADPTGDFLFGDQIGYCVHFAHAAVYLWRTLGIPSRVGTGYHVDEDERHGGSSMLVRGRDAHAWPELYLEGYGWVVLDIAPKTNLDPPSPPVDTELQRMLGEMARALPENAAEASSSPALPSGLARDLAYGMLLSAAGAALVLYAVKIWRRFAPRFSGAKSLPWVGYRGALDMLSEVGHTRRAGESREAFARRVRAVAPAFEALTALHLRAALGDPRKRAEASVDPWRAGLAELRTEVARGVGLKTRLLGLLNPVSFFGSR
jgi:transglutaminase-like putative cysteine protease